MSQPLKLRRALIAVLSWMCLSADAAPGYQYQVPDTIPDGWETSSAADEKIDLDLLQPMFERIASGQYKAVQSVLIARHGKLVVEEYFPRTESDRREQAIRRAAPVDMTSATKSVTSLLIGIAIDQHFIKSVDENASTFFPEYADLFADPRRAQLRLKNLLTMSAGFEWDEWSHPYSDPRNTQVQMIRSEEPMRFLLERPMVAAPGETFTYNSGISILLGQLLFKASGLRADKFSERHLFEPLGISDFYWSKWPDDIVQAGGGLHLRPRDMAKIGQLMLNLGQWRGRQIVSEAWVKESIKPHLEGSKIPFAAMADGYGYQWWLSSWKVRDRELTSYSARGRGGQFIVVLPEVQAVVVFTCAVDNPITFAPLEMLKLHILPAIGDSSSLPKPSSRDH
jgi:CubicO group peptidase (beta-lactamase class C family)